MVIFVFFFVERRNTHGPKHGSYIFECLIVWRIAYNIKEYGHISDMTFLFREFLHLGTRIILTL